MPVGVRVDVGRDVHPRGPRRIDQRDGFGHERPVLLTGRLQVIDVDRDPGALSDLKGFADGVEDRVALVPHVSEVDAAVLACHARQLDELVGGGVYRGWVNQRRGDPHGPVFHGLPHEGLHLFDLGKVGPHVALAQHKDYRNMNVRGFTRTLENARAFQKLAEKAEEGDKSVQVEYLIARLDLHHLDVAAGRKELKTLKLSKEERKQIEAKLDNLQIMEILADTNHRVKGSRAAGGKKCLLMEDLGRIPTGKREESYFWWLISIYAQEIGDVTAQQKVVDFYRDKKKSGKKIDERYLKRQVEALRKMKEDS